MKSFFYSFCFSILFLSASGSASAQAYNKFLDNKAWMVNYLGNYFSYDIFYFKLEDTIISQKTYTKIFRYYKDSAINYMYNEYLYVREDTTTRQVFIRNHPTFSERILYDFSLNIGGSWSFYDLYNTYYTFQLDSIGETDTIVDKRRPIHWYSYGSTIPTTKAVIEGIGSRNDPFYIMNFTITVPDLFLRCVYKDSTSIYPTWVNDCPVLPNIKDSLLTAQKTDLEKINVSLIHNSQEGIIRVKSENELKKFVLIDLNGKMILNFVDQDKTIEFESSSLKGVYIFKYFSGNSFGSGKILIP